MVRECELNRQHARQNPHSGCSSIAGRIFRVGGPLCCSLEDRRRRKRSDTSRSRRMTASIDLTAFIIFFFKYVILPFCVVETTKRAESDFFNARFVVCVAYMYMLWDLWFYWIFIRLFYDGMWCVMVFFCCCVSTQFVCWDATRQAW